MTNQVKKTTIKKDFYFTIYSTIKSEGRLPDPIKIGISKQRLNYWVQPLKQANLIEFIGKVWKVKRDLSKKELLERVKKTKVVTTRKASLETSKKNQLLRYHSLQFQIKLPRFNYWHRRTTYLDKKEIPYKTIYGGKQRVMYKGVIFHLCSDSIIFYCPENVNIYGKTTVDILNRAFSWAKEQVLGFNGYLGMDLRIKGKFVINLTRGEVEETNNELANSYQENKEKLEIYDKEELWLIADKSLKTSNLEFKSAKRHLADVDNVIPLFNDLRKRDTPITLTDLETKFNSNEDKIKYLTNLLSRQQDQITMLNNLLEEVLDNKGENRYI